jgi:hypothetical protein
VTVTNTAKAAKEAPLLELVEARLVGLSAMIENQEARGQAELVRSEVLPTNGIEAVRGMIESQGGSIGEKVDGDEMFTNVKLPEGWEKRRTDHSMWSDLCDDKGRKRAAIFYKAASYDRSASISACLRFQIDRYGHDVEGEVRVSIKDACGEVDFSTDIVQVRDGEEEEWDIRDRLADEARAHLDEHFPDWSSPNAYWD